MKKRKLIMTGFDPDQQNIYPHPTPATHLFTKKIAHPVNGTTAGTTQFSIQCAKNEFIR